MCGNLIVSKGSLYVYLFELNLRNLLYVISLYGSWAQVFRAKKVTDYDAVLEPLEDEKGNVYNVGLKKSFGKKTP